MTSIDQLNREQLAQKFVDYLNATDEQREQQVKKGHASERKAHGRVRVAKSTATCGERLTTVTTAELAAFLYPAQGTEE